MNQSEIGVQGVLVSYTGPSGWCFCTVMDMYACSSVHSVLDLHKTRLDSGVIQSHTLFVDLQHNLRTELYKLGWLFQECMSSMSPEGFWQIWSICIGRQQAHTLVKDCLLCVSTFLLKGGFCQIVLAQTIKTHLFFW